jgi:hypothetical protein
MDHHPECARRMQVGRGSARGAGVSSPEFLLGSGVLGNRQARDQSSLLAKVPASAT